MKAIYAHRTYCVVVEDTPIGVLLEPVFGTNDQRFWAGWEDPNLMLDPTDEDVEDVVRRLE